MLYKLTGEFEADAVSFSPGVSVDFLVVIVEFIDSMRTFLKCTQDSGDRRLKLGS